MEPTGSLALIAQIGCVTHYGKRRWSVPPLGMWKDYVSDDEMSKTAQKSSISRCLADIFSYNSSVVLPISIHADNIQLSLHQSR
jgi:hypothetical protein